jgi:hypothetical protein
MKNGLYLKMVILMIVEMKVSIVMIHMMKLSLFLRRKELKKKLLLIYQESIKEFVKL